MKDLRLGIIGSGRIAGRFLNEFKGVKGARVTAVYNKRLQGARELLERTACQALACSDIKELWSLTDCVYIASPHETHFEYARQALEMGKHVLCEKPMCFEEERVKELYRLADKNGLLLLEAIKTAYCPSFIYLQELIKNNAIGRVVAVEAAFSKLGDGAGRELFGKRGGSFCELGSYGLLPVVRLLGCDNESLDFFSLESPVHTDAYTCCRVGYRDAIGIVKTGLGAKTEGELIVTGDKGYIRVAAPWWLNGRIEVHHEDSRRVEEYSLDQGTGLLACETQYFIDGIKTLKEGGLPLEGALTAEDSRWIAGCFEAFIEKNKENYEKKEAAVAKAMKSKAAGIWAHRGCSFRYPENTLAAFRAAAELPGIRGIELDVQLSRDGELIVQHDERLERCSDGEGYLKDQELKDIKALQVTGSGSDRIVRMEDFSGGDMEVREDMLKIPTLREVFDLLTPYIRKNNLFINIELKNSIIAYEGMEERVIALAEEYGIEENIVYSSFNPASMGIIKELRPKALTGILGGNSIDCLEMADKYRADAIHPARSGLPVSRGLMEEIRSKNLQVRFWGLGEPFYGEEGELRERDARKYTLLGATDIITNVPEDYLA